MRHYVFSCILGEFQGFKRESGIETLYLIVLKNITTGHTMLKLKLQRLNVDAVKGTPVTESDLIC